MNSFTFDCPYSFYRHAEILLNHGVIFYGVSATLTIVLLTGEDT